MTAKQLSQTQKWIREELFSCLEFWLNKGLDAKYGGVYTCLDRSGKIYSIDKSVWMQGRCAWTYSYACKIYGVKDAWLQAAESCLEFMEKYCFNPKAENRMYFIVTADGRPVRQRRYWFSECFYVIANAEAYQLTGKKAYLERARRIYEFVYKLNHQLIEDPTGLGTKEITETRSTRSLATPMIYLNICNVLRRTDPDHGDEYEARAAECIEDIMRYHVRADLGCTLENTGENGEFRQKTTSGRLVNPGHDIECSWFMMEYAQYLQPDQKEKIYRQARLVFDQAIKAGWDQEYGGLLYMIDCLGKPPESYEHDMKIWWPHNEILIASLMLYQHTQEEQYWQWFMKTVDYCRQYFSDPEYGEWFGYLRRDGQPTEPAPKGTIFKGPFHLPRSLIMADLLLGDIQQQNLF